MESILPIIGVGLLGLLTFAGIFWSIRSISQRREAAFSQLAARHGWSYQRGQGSRAPYRLGGSARSGDAWELVVSFGRSSSGSSSMGSTIWQAPSISTGQAVLIGPRPPKMPDWISFDQSMLNVMLSKLLGMDASSLAGIRPLELGSEALRERYLILGSQERDAQALLSAQSEQALLSWITSDEHGELPAVVFWQHGLQIKFRRAISDIQQLEQIVTLGEAMLEALGTQRSEF